MDDDDDEVVVVVVVSSRRKSFLSLALSRNNARFKRSVCLSKVPNNLFVLLSDETERDRERLIRERERD